MRLYNPLGDRLYLNSAERGRFARCAEMEPPAVRLLCLVLLHSGCRISEALALSERSFQLANGSVLLITLKRRKRGLVREIPMPDSVFLLLRPFPPGSTLRLFPFHRSTAWRLVKDVLQKAGVSGACAMPKGLRHGFAVNAIQCGVPLDLVARWMGHASLRTTSIYTHVMGPEERAIASRMWGTTSS